MKLTLDQCARMIDHTFVKAFATEDIMRQLCKEALDYHFAMVAINSGQTRFCKEQLLGTDIHVGAAISFPLGQTSIESKVFETKDAIEKGADEIDYQLNITEVKAKHWDVVKKEMEAIVYLSHQNNKICKVILETAYLEKEDIIKICEIANDVQPDFVKTSTGFAPTGATVEDVQLMKSIVQSPVQVKASGGIRDAKTFKAMLTAGATRIGTSAGIQIIEELRKEVIDGYIYV